MLFTSYGFIGFLMICFVLYYLIPKRFQWMLLLAASYTFYFLSGMRMNEENPMAGGFGFVTLLFSVTAVTYLTAVAVEYSGKKSAAYLKEHKKEFSQPERKAYRKQADRKKKGILLAGLLSALAILAVFKYADFAVENAQRILDRLGSAKELDYFDLMLPMGISFYTFQSLGYLLDVYWEKVEAQKGLAKYMLFVSFFPQLVQGPISRYSDLAASLYAEHSFDWKRIRFGLERILWGFFKKLVVADTIAIALETILDDDYYDGAWMAVALLFYSVRLYADFTGGTDITIGVAEVFGVRVQENFIRPFFSKNITEFWRRWHITMGTWFRDYIFYPMSIAPWMNKLVKFSRKNFGKGITRRVPVYLATLVTWFATGLWHGAAWRYVGWGVLNGVIILISGELEPLYARFWKRFPRLVASRGYAGFQVFRTFLLMSSLRIFDLFKGFRYCISRYIRMFRYFDIKALTRQEFLDLGLNQWQYLIVLAGVVVMLCVSLAGRSGSVREKLDARPYAVRYLVFVMLFLSVLLFGSYGVGYDEAQFIYNQF